MEWLPFPRTKQGWITAFLLILVLFVTYYWILFSVLEKFYETALYTTKSLEVEPVKCDEQNQKVLQQLELEISSPRYAAPFGARWFFVTIHNKNEQPIEDIKLWIELRPKEAERLVLPSIFGNSFFVEKSLHLSRLEPNSTTSGRILLYTILDTEMRVWLHINSKCIAKIENNLPTITIDILKYLSHSFIENILLPPWSNLILCVAVIVICYITEKKEKEENLIDLSSMSLIAGVILPMRWLLRILSLTFMLISLPWLFPSKLFELLLLIIFLLMMIYYKPEKYKKSISWLPKKIYNMAEKLRFVISWLSNEKPIFAIKVVLTIVIIGMFDFISWKMGPDVEPILKWAILFWWFGNLCQNFTKSKLRRD
jgi:hypothetical protein